MDAIIYHGDKKARDEIRRNHMPRTLGPKFPVVITSYEIVLYDAKKHLRHYSWKYLVVDEVLVTVQNFLSELCASARHLSVAYPPIFCY